MRGGATGVFSGVTVGWGAADDVLGFAVADVLYYVDEDGRCPFEDWFSRLDPAAVAKVATALTRLEAGNDATVKPVGESVLEYRIDWGPGYRIYFGRDGAALVILLTGGTKKRQQRDIETAKLLWLNYKRRRRG